MASISAVEVHILNFEKQSSPFGPRTGSNHWISVPVCRTKERSYNVITTGLPLHNVTGGSTEES